MQIRVTNRYRLRPIDIAVCSALLLAASAAMAAGPPDASDPAVQGQGSTLTTVVVSGQEIEQQSATHRPLP